MKRIIVFSDGETWENMGEISPLIYSVTDEEYQRILEGEKARDVLKAVVAVSIPRLLSGLDPILLIALGLSKA